ncbi:hypothetical protein AAVH_16728 [Aphelenchoides avenae]|nr:hypothetical protein AAVH_16728 [Aphelenchus avenae]
MSRTLVVLLAVLALACVVSAQWGMGYPGMGYGMGMGYPGMGYGGFRRRWGYGGMGGYGMGYPGMGYGMWGKK